MTTPLPTQMDAVAISEPGGPEVLQLLQRPTPTISADEVLIEVHAAGVNRPDCLQRLGLYQVPADADPLPGLEVAGTVVSIGNAVSQWQIGDRVVALTHGGAYAQYCRAHESHCLPVPEALTMVEAAAVPETFFTVWYNAFMRAGLIAGETLLVHGGSSGIGSTAIQLAKARGAKVITTAGSQDKCDFCSTLGADLAINYKSEDWQAQVKEYTDGQGVNVVLDMVAGSYIQKNIDSLASEGRYSMIAFLQGPKAEVNFAAVLRNRLTITGSTLRPRTVAEKGAIAAELATNVWPLFASGNVKPRIYTTFPLEKACDAHTLMESSKHMGKIVLTVDLK